jgi:hypothetical protein
MVELLSSMHEALDSITKTAKKRYWHFQSHLILGFFVCLLACLFVVVFLTTGV